MTVPFCIFVKDGFQREEKKRTVFEKPLTAGNPYSNMREPGKEFGNEMYGIKKHHNYNIVM